MSSRWVSVGVCRNFTKILFLLQSVSVGTVRGCCLLFLLQSVSGGIIRGCGQQKIGALANAFGFMCVGIPLSASLMFATDLGIYGNQPNVTQITNIIATICAADLCCNSKESYSRHTRKLFVKRSGQQHISCYTVVTTRPPGGLYCTKRTSFFQQHI